MGPTGQLFAASSSGHGTMSPCISIDNIPEDILYHVLNAFLLKREILRCSLLSKKWRSAAFVPAFRSLSLRVKSEKDPSPSDIQVNRFVEDLVQDPFFSSIQHIVRRLTLKWGRDPGHDIEFDFVNFIPFFPAMSSLTLQGMVCRRLPTSHNHLKGSLALDELIISGLTQRHDQCHSVEALCDLLSTFGSLKSLMLHRLFFWNWEKYPVDHSATDLRHWTLPHPVSLVLEDVKLFKEFQGFFYQADMLKELKNLDIAAARSEIRGGGDAMRLCVSSLESLSLSLVPELLEVHEGPEGHMERNFERVTDHFSSLRALKALVLGIEIQEAYDHCRMLSPAGIEAATATIRALAPNISLGHIELCFCYEPVMPERKVARLKHVLSYARDPLDELEAALVHHVEAGCIGHVRVGLYVVNLSLGFRFTPSDLLPSSDYLSTLFPRLFKRGVLHPHDC